MFHVKHENTDSLPLAPEELVRAVYRIRLDRVHVRLAQRFVVTGAIILLTLAAVLFFTLS